MKPLIVTINTSINPSSPCEEDGWKLYSFARNKFVTDVDPERFVVSYDGRTGEVTPANAALKRQLDRGLAFWLSYFEHGDGKWSLKGEGTQCRWDTTSLAGILVWEWPAEEMGAKTPEARAQDARHFLERYSEWGNGYVHDWEVREPGEEEPIDSGSEWIGSDEMLQAIKAVVGDQPVIARGGLGWMLSKSEFAIVDADALLEELL